jgi:hypothetical protein
MSGRDIILRMTVCKVADQKWASISYPGEGHRHLALLARACRVYHVARFGLEYADQTKVGTPWQGCITAGQGRWLTPTRWCRAACW